MYIVKKDDNEEEEKKERKFISCVDRKMFNDRTSLISSDESFQYSDKENFNETISSYSIAFDKNQQNFSTSSEISFIKERLSSKTIVEQQPTKFNPFLLLFMHDDDHENPTPVINMIIDLTSLIIFPSFRITTIEIFRFFPKK